MLFKMKLRMGKHYIRRSGRKVVLRPGDQIDCEKHELGGAIHKFEQMEPDPPPSQPKVGLKLVARGGNWFDVVNEVTGKAINDRGLRRQEAEELVRKGPAELPPISPKFWLSACGKGLFNVVEQATDKPINDEPLSKADAVDLLAEVTDRAADLNHDSTPEGENEKTEESK